MKQSITLVTGQTICLPDDYVKFELPPETPTYVSIGVDIKDIPKVSDKDFSVTLNAYFIVKWRDPRIIVSDARNLSVPAGQLRQSQTANRNYIVFRGPSPDGSKPRNTQRSLDAGRRNSQSPVF